jgi:hypothetical protein
MKKFKADKKKGTTRVKMAPLESLHEGTLVLDKAEMLQHMHQKDDPRQPPVMWLTLMGSDINQGKFMAVQKLLKEGKTQGIIGKGTDAMVWKLHEPGTEPFPRQHLDIQDPGAVNTRAMKVLEAFKTDDQMDALRYAVDAKGPFEMPGPGPNQKVLTSRTGITVTVEGPARFYRWQDISHQENRKYTWEGSWLNIPHPVFLAVLDDGSHFIINQVADAGKPQKLQGSHIPVGWKQIGWDIPDKNGRWGN